MELENIGILDPEGKNMNPLTGLSYSDTYKKLSKKWSVLPAYKKINDILKKLGDNQVILVISSTGSGKTVLLPKALLHIFNYKGHIAVTLPKQIIAKSAAEYAAMTLDVEIGTHVGYKYKGSEKKNSGSTKLLYATDGTIVAKLLKDPLLSDFDGVCIDEAHEMKVQISFLLYLLKQTVKKRPEFKLVIMSATINETIFEDYFKEYKFGVINIGGERTFPIQSIYLDKPISQNEYLVKGTELIKKLLKEKENKDEGNDILFFVPSVNDTIDACKIFSADEHGFCIEVYAGMNPVKQDLAQDENMYKEQTGKKRKIVIATNVAESSLTISGIKYVIDSGLELYSYYDPKIRSKVLNKKLITRAQATQRMGRTGRTAPGVCYHLYTKNDFDNIMEKYPEPAIRVSNIYGECLRLLNLPTIQTVTNLRKILSEFIESPKEEYINDAIMQLTQLGLIDDDNVNDLGKKIAQLQLDPPQGLALYAGYNLNCVREVIAIIALIDAMKANMGDLFIKPNMEQNGDNSRNKGLLNKYDDGRKQLSDKYGDHIVLLKIFIKYTKFLETNKSADAWIYKHFLKKSTLDKARTYYKKILGNAKQNLFTSKKKVIIEDIMSYKLEHRVMASILYGYKLNKGFLNQSGDKYNTGRANNVTLSRDSFLKYYKLHKEIIYHELFTTNNKTEMIISSIYSTESKNLEKKFNDNVML